MPKLALLKHNFTKLQKAQVHLIYQSAAHRPSHFPPRNYTPYAHLLNRNAPKTYNYSCFFPPISLNSGGLCHQFCLISCPFPLPHMHQLKWFEDFNTHCFVGHLLQDVHAGCDCRTVFLLQQPLHAHSAAFSLALMPVGSHSLGAAVSWVQWCAHCNKEQVIWWR